MAKQISMQEAMQAVNDYAESKHVDKTVLVMAFFGIKFAYNESAFEEVDEDVKQKHMKILDELLS